MSASQVRKAEMDRLHLDVERYTVVLAESGFLYALRDGEPWRDLAGDGLILALAQEIDRLRAQVAVDEREPGQEG